MAVFGDLSISEKMLLQFEVQEFLYLEASLLDERRYEDWLELLTEDIDYWMPIRRTTTAREVGQEFTKRGEMAFFDDDFDTLKMRVARLGVGRAWAEDPPSRTRRLITNVRILDADGDDIHVTSNFQLYRTRLNSEEDSWIGRRDETVRRSNGTLKLARRHLYLEQTVILAQNMSSLF